LFATAPLMEEDICIFIPSTSPSVTRMLGDFNVLVIANSSPSIAREVADMRVLMLSLPSRINIVKTKAMSDSNFCCSLHTCSNFRSENEVLI